MSHQTQLDLLMSKWQSSRDRGDTSRAEKTCHECLELLFGIAVAEAVTVYRSGVQEKRRNAESELTAAQVKAGEFRKRLIVSFVMAASVLLLLAGGRTAAAPPKKNTKQTTPPKSANSTIKGKLAAGDRLDNFPPTKKSFCKTHTVKLKAGAYYQIDLNGGFDTFLRIEDAQKKPLLYNDDVSGPTNLDSRLILHAKKGGDYRLIVTSFKPGATGTYTIKHHEVKPDGKAKITKSALTERDKNKSGRFAKTFKIKLAAGKPYTIIAESKKFDTVMLLIDPTGKKTLHAQNNDIAPGNKNSRIDFTPTVTAEYTLIVGSVRPGEGGEFSFRVQAFAK